jgi:integrase
LTPKTVEHLKEPGRHGDGGGLYLQVTPAKGGGVNRSWLFLYRGPSDKGVNVAGKLRYHGLGSLHDVSLAEARKRAARLRLERLDGGVDPIERKIERRRAAAFESSLRMSFDQAAAAYISAHLAAWRGKRVAEDWARTLAIASPVLGKLPVAAIDTGLVLKVIEPLWTSKNETASRIRGRIEQILDWARVRGYRQGENPARWRGHLDKLLPPPAKVHKTKHHAAVDYKQIASAMSAIRAREGSTARALEFLILCASRPSEIFGARWSEIDLQSKVWTIPASRMKTGREHRVPLSSAALRVLASIPRGGEGDLVFRTLSGRMLYHLSLLEHARAIGGNATVHGFRSSFRDWAGNETDTPREICEHALARIVGNAVELAYRRGDALERRRVLMEKWADYCGRPPPTDGAATVLTMKGRRAV